MELVVISREEAREQGLKKYFTGVPCTKGHTFYRYVTTGSCVECEQGKSKRRLAEIKADPILLAKHRADRNAYHKIYQANDTGSVREKRKSYPSRRPEVRRDVCSRSYHANKAPSFATSARRRANQLLATPTWYDHKLATEMFKLTAVHSDTTGIAHHVDHYFPLKGEGVCGLHIVDNFMCTTVKENLKKNNKHPDDWEEEKTKKGLSFPRPLSLLELRVLYPAQEVSNTFLYSCTE